MEVRLLPTRPLADRLTAGQRALNPPIVVRIHVYQPAQRSLACRVVATATRPAVNRKDPGSNPGPTANSVASVTQRLRARLLIGTRWVRLPPLAPIQASSNGRTS